MVEYGQAFGSRAETAPDQNQETQKEKPSRIGRWLVTLSRCLLAALQKTQELC